MKTEVSDTPSASAFRTAQAVAELIRTTEHEVNARPINSPDAADIRQEAVERAAALIEADRADLLVALQATVNAMEHAKKLLRAAGFMMSGGTITEPYNVALAQGSSAIAKHTRP